MRFPRRLEGSIDDARGYGASGGSGGGSEGRRGVARGLVRQGGRVDAWALGFDLAGETETEGMRRRAETRGGRRGYGEGARQKKRSEEG